MRPRPALSLRLSPGASNADPPPPAQAAATGRGVPGDDVSLGPECFSAPTKGGGVLTIDTRGRVRFAPGGGTASAASSTSTAPAPAPATAPHGLTMADLRLGARLGQGASATVYTAVHVPTGRRVAVKLLLLHDPRVREQLLAELRALYASDCEALVGFHGATYTPEGSCVAVVLEECDLRGLDAVLAAAPGHSIPERALAGVAWQVLWGLAYLAHERRVHRDVKPANVLVCSSGRVALSDFGIARELSASILARTFVGSARYMAPERIAHRPYDARSDVWSAGLALLEAAVGRYPYEGDAAEGWGEEEEEGGGGGGGGRGGGALGSHIALVMAITESDPPLPPPSERHSPELLGFLRRALARDPNARATAAELLSSPWFAQHGIASLADARERLREWLVDVGLARHGGGSGGGVGVDGSSSGGDPQGGGDGGDLQGGGDRGGPESV